MTSFFVRTTDHVFMIAGLDGLGCKEMFSNMYFRAKGAGGADSPRWGESRGSQGTYVLGESGLTAPGFQDNRKKRDIKFREETLPSLSQTGESSSLNLIASPHAGFGNALVPLRFPRRAFVGKC